MPQHICKNQAHFMIRHILSYAVPGTIGEGLESGSFIRGVDGVVGFDPAFRDEGEGVGEVGGRGEHCVLCDGDCCLFGKMRLV